ncbi:TetR/AcrR family transcriptional regulator [Conexibacter arvalis]|uniref:AcrR family transcriptional regulator n=1 Tax=Conexibacter arvalis TaxID=912552 RepID=A0A840I8Q9_9ACTN|nr:TetR/AcrR family transcriptional regulator [Conexibacter arvalis]MBB4661277.1 AcrR family transcriptional regulator [Conexibacter arvalis]
MSSSSGQHADAPEPVEVRPAGRGAAPDADASQPQAADAAPTTKERIVYASAELFRRQGFSGTGVKQIVAEAKAPFGSLYHHFPGGKEQLGEQVIRIAGGMYGQLVAAVIDPHADIVSGIEEAFRLAGVHLADSGWADACPIATITLETASSSEAMRTASRDVFEAWFAALAGRFQEAGIPAERARSLAISTLALLEGAFIFARAARTTEALDAAGRTAADAVRAALAER